MNKPKTSEVNALDVGKHFLTKYYNAMAHDIDQVIHFYSDSSNLKRFGKPVVSGLENIKSELKKNVFDNFNVRVFDIICLNSLEDSIIVQVSGEFVQKSGEGRAFIQNVVLASQGPGKYYIYSDMIEWLADLYPTLSLQKLNMSDSNDAQHHYNNGQSNKRTEAVAAHEEDLFVDHSLPEPIHQNGQLHQHPSQQLHSDLHNVIDQQQVSQQQQLGGHQGAPVRNIQSFINQAAAAVSNQEQSKPDHDFKQMSQLKEQFKASSKPDQALQPQQQAPSVAAQITEDTGLRTWAKLVSGQIKSNGLPPPTQPPPTMVEPFQTMDKKIKTQQEFQRNEQRREGGFRKDFNRDRPRNERGDRNERAGDGERGDREDRPFRQRRGGPRGEGGEDRSSNKDRSFRRNYEGQRGGDNAGQQKFRGAYQGSKSDRPPRQPNNTGASHQQTRA